MVAYETLCGGGRGSAAFIIIPINTGFFTLYLRTGTPIGQLNPENKKTFKSWDLKVLVLLKFSRKLHLAEKEGFEPPDLLQSTVFKTAAIDHSAISPVRCKSLPHCGCKYSNLFCFCKYILLKNCKILKAFF